MSHRIIVAGDRNWTGPDLENKIQNLLLQMPKTSIGEWDVIIFHGACRGVDMTADKIAKELVLP